jgi:hypothetical protein
VGAAVGAGVGRGEALAAGEALGGAEAVRLATAVGTRDAVGLSDGVGAAESVGTSDIVGEAAVGSIETNRPIASVGLNEAPVPPPPPAGNLTRSPAATRTSNSAAAPQGTNQRGIDLTRPIVEVLAREPPGAALRPVATRRSRCPRCPGEPGPWPSARSCGCRRSCFLGAHCSFDRRCRCTCRSAD